MSQNKILESVEKAVSAVAGPWHESQSIVLTNGCFDILTAGHVRLLQAASTLGPLFVAVDSDDNVMWDKGSERPINCLQHRMEVLGAIECVSRVFPFSGDVADVVEKLRPSFLVKEAEWVGKVRGAEYAGCVVLIEHSIEISSTETLKRKGDRDNADHPG